MKYLTIFSLIVTLMIACLLPLFLQGVKAQTNVNNGAFDPLKSQSQFQLMLRQALKEHPEIIVEALQLYQENEQFNATENKSNALKMLKKMVADDPKLPSAGAAPNKAKLTIVEFYDFQCSYCKKIYPNLQRLLDEKDDLRIVFIDFPILGPQSVQASKAGMAAARQGKYYEFHKALYTRSGGINEDVIIKSASGLGLNMEQFKRDRNDPSLDSILTSNRELAKKLQIEGTPALVINNTVIPGYLEYDDLIKLLSSG